MKQDPGLAQHNGLKAVTVILGNTIEKTFTQIETQKLQLGTRATSFVKMFQMSGIVFSHLCYEWTVFGKEKSHKYLLILHVNYFNHVNNVTTKYSIESFRIEILYF